MVSDAKTKQKETTMQKLILMVAIAASAVFANAASFDWKVQTGADYTGMNVYAISGSSAASILAVCQSTDSAKWSDVFSAFPSYTVTGNNSRAGANGSSDGISANDNLVFVIVNGAVAEGSKYWVANDYSIPAANVYEPPATGTSLTINFANQGTVGSGTFTAVPEPTSGLLMLLGMAGLALRRRRA